MDLFYYFCEIESKYNLRSYNENLRAVFLCSDKLHINVTFLKQKCTDLEFYTVVIASAGETGEHSPYQPAVWPYVYMYGICEND